MLDHLSYIIYPALNVDSFLEISSHKSFFCTFHTLFVKFVMKKEITKGLDMQCYFVTTLQKK